MPIGMTAHILIPAIDADAPASASPAIISEIIRGEIGFDGLLMCDDLGMGALSGTMQERARAVIDAGCDLVLHCSGNFARWRPLPRRRRCCPATRSRRFDAAPRPHRGAPSHSTRRAPNVCLAEILGEIA